MDGAFTDPCAPEENINVQIFVPDYQVQKCLCAVLEETVWQLKQKVLAALPQDQNELFNYGLFLPPCNGRAGKFLLEERLIKDYPFQDCVPYLELKYKKRVYKMLTIDEKTLKQLHSKSNLKKFMDLVAHKQAEKVDKLLKTGLDPNFHDHNGETPLTVASGLPKSRTLLMSLVSGGAHLDYRNTEGQTPLHKAAFLENPDNVKTLLELGSSPNYKDPLGLTPLYYCMLQERSSADAAELLLRDFATFGIVDPHGNHELHQACKNGLVQHVEHLLYYGADLNARNINGNTPLHVCAVNNRDSCARVLLFRGADASLKNNQQQSAHHVAVIVGNAKVADVIRSHDPAKCVPYRGMPRYNSKRRGTLSRSNSLQRTRSFSQSSLCSTNSSDTYGTLVRSQTHNTPLCHQRPRLDSMNSAVSASRASQGSDYGTLPMRKFHPEAIRESPAGLVDVNVPRILVIPRGPKGFGFILRGAKKMEPGVAFEPSATVPGLQFFEGVDMNGMAMRAGLKPGDFLLEINGVDVRSASHDQVVGLIQNTSDTITLKVVTVDSEPQSHYATLPSRGMRARSLFPPAPPRRHPSTSLSVATGRQALLCFDGPSLMPAKSMENIPRQNSMDYDDPQKIASVRNRPSNSRRISALELEQLMARQGNTPEMVMDDPNGTGARKYSSVADMKRRKHKASVPCMPMPGLPRTPIYGQPAAPDPPRPALKSFASSPNLQTPPTTPMGGRYWSDQPSPSNEVFSSNGRRVSITSEASDYSRPFRPASRPKTPPPPPPVPVNSASPPVAPPPPPPCPPPPPEQLRKAPEIKEESPYSAVKTKADCRGITAEALCNVKLNKTPQKTEPQTNNSMSNLLKQGLEQRRAAMADTPDSDSKAARSPPNTASASSGKPDFDTDLRAALAKRRTKMNNTPDKVENKPPVHTVFSTGDTKPPRIGLSLKESVQQTVNKPPQKSSPPPVTNGFGTKKDSGYTSSRTSLEPSECGDETSSNGTTVLRIEPPDASRSPDFPPPPPPEFLNASMNGASDASANKNRVSMLSQQLEDTFGGVPPPALPKKPAGLKRELTNKMASDQDSLSVTSTLSTLSGCSESTSDRSSQHQPSPPLPPPMMPPPDYDADSGTGDSESEDVTPNLSRMDLSNRVPSMDFASKPLPTWNVSDACDWLHSISLSEYKTPFVRAQMDGKGLMKCDRALFTRLGVTRIAHRKSMETSLKKFLPNNTTAF